MKNPTIIIPGRTENMSTRPEKSKEFPKMVYTAGLQKYTVIHSEEERPDGYYDHAEAAGMAVEPEDVNDDLDNDKADAERAKLEDEKAKRELALAKKEERKALKAYLDEHNVQYHANISTEKLQELKVKLDEHLAQQDSPNDDEQHSDSSGVPRE